MPPEPRQSHDDVVRSLGDSVVAGGVLAFVIAAGAFFVARVARLFRRQH